MNDIVLELSLFFLGCLCGLAYFRQECGLRPAHIAAASVVIGTMCAFSANELLGTLTTAFACVTFDSAKVVAGWAGMLLALKTLQLSQKRSGTHATKENSKA